ncbi:MAG: hypothetical protein WD603_02660 [Patescibacteria group bacterium]
MAISEQQEQTYEFPIDPPMPEVLPPTASVREVEPLHYLSCLHFHRENIPRFVEQPLVEACQMLFDKNVRTTLTSANRHDRVAVMFIDYDTLTPANRTVAGQIGRVRPIPDTSCSLVQIEIPISADSTVGSVSADAAAVAELFEAQPAEMIAHAR